jgi:hypothetical protein
MIDQYRAAILEYAKEPLPLGRLQAPNSYKIFEISPNNDHRLFPRCIKPASDTVLWNLLDYVQDHKGVALSETFKSTSQALISGPMADSIFRGCFHRHVGRPTLGRYHRLNPVDKWRRKGWMTGGFNTQLFTRDDDFAWRLARGVRLREPVYLYSHSQIFPTVDAIAYEPDEPLRILQINALKHGPSGSSRGDVFIDGASLTRILGLIRIYVRVCYKLGEKHQDLEDLCNTPLDIIAVVPRRKKRSRFCEWLRRRQTVGVTVSLRNGAAAVPWRGKFRSYELESDPEELLDMRLKGHPDVFKGTV